LEQGREKISIIVPVYKVEKYLGQCVESILNQTYSNLEIILVDDGSPDACPEICDEYQKRDNRIKVIHKQNGGLSDARNAGLDIVTGDYIGFVDSDDWISPTMYEELLDTVQEYNVEIAFCGYRTTDENGNVKQERGFGDRRKSPVKDLVNDIIYCDGDNVVVWNKLYHAEIFKKVRFPVGALHEDNAIIWKTLGQIKSVAYTGTYEYYYRQSAQGIMSSGNIEKRVTAIRRFEQETKSFVLEQYPELSKLLPGQSVDILWAFLYIYIDRQATDSDEYKVLRKEFSAKLPYVLKEKKYSLKQKIEAVLICLRVYEPSKRLWRLIRGKKD